MYNKITKRQYMFRKQTFKKLKKSKDSKCKNIANNAPKKINSKGIKEYTNGVIMEALVEIKESYKKLMEKWEEQISVYEELKQELRYVKRKLNDKEQQELNNNIIIQEIPFKDGGKVEAILGKNSKQFKSS